MLGVVSPFVGDGQFLLKLSHLLLHIVSFQDCPHQGRTSMEILKLIWRYQKMFAIVWVMAIINLNFPLWMLRKDNCSQLFELCRPISSNSGRSSSSEAIPRNSSPELSPLQLQPVRAHHPHDYHPNRPHHHRHHPPNLSWSNCCECPANEAKGKSPIDIHSLFAPFNTFLFGGQLYLR